MESRISLLHAGLEPQLTHQPLRIQTVFSFCSLVALNALSVGMWSCFYQRYLYFTIFNVSTLLDCLSFKSLLQIIWGRLQVDLKVDFAILQNTR